MIVEGLLSLHLHSIDTDTGRATRASSFAFWLFARHRERWSKVIRGRKERRRGHPFKGGVCHWRLNRGHQGVLLAKKGLLLWISVCLALLIEEDEWKNELFFSIRRCCCSGADVCLECWPHMTIALR
ncbi:uncharacterized protein LOC112200957 [Rosa chinensis]|uniref:uncharacterized protein LOC112200957 n=1 Tax=Rosa chinensis TaxID=74649 RepID=UPI001AD8D38C|nr:uncharacterized protein LOC112200957 [Rosa chinensis]